MKNNNIKTQIIVKEHKINVLKINNKEYISLTNLARYKNNSNPGDVIIKWMSNKSSFDFYYLWEELFNEGFKLAKSREFKNDSANQSFTMSPSKWIKETNATDIIQSILNLMIVVKLITLTGITLSLINCEESST